MRLGDFKGKKADEVRARLGAANETERLDLLVGLVIVNQQGPGTRSLCPGCIEGHNRDRSKFTDNGGRVWHMNCIAIALAGINPEHPPVSFVDKPVPDGVA